MRLAIVGTGRMALIRGAALASAPEIEKITVVSENRERRLRLAHRLGATDCDLPGLSERDIDAIVICTQSSAHHALIRWAAERHLPVFCEKPIALSLEETRNSISMMEDAGAALQVGFHRRFDPEILRIYEKRVAGELGTLYMLRSSAYDRDLPPEYYMPTSGGIWRDLHVHDFDLIQWMTGEAIRSVFACGTVRADDRFARYSDSDTSAVLAVTSGGIPCVVTGARHNAVGYDVRFEATGSAGSLIAGIGSRRAIKRPDETTADIPWEGFAERFGDAYEAEMMAFVQLVSGKGKNLCPSEVALEALRVAIACERSVAERREVLVEEIPV